MVFRWWWWNVKIKNRMSIWVLESVDHMTFCSSTSSSRAWLVLFSLSEERSWALWTLQKWCSAADSSKLWLDSFSGWQVHENRSSQLKDIKSSSNIHLNYRKDRIRKHKALGSVGTDLPEAPLWGTHPILPGLPIRDFLLQHSKFDGNHLFEDLGQCIKYPTWPNLSWWSLVKVVGHNGCLNHVWRPPSGLHLPATL